MNAYEATNNDENIYVTGSDSDNYVYLRVCNLGKIDDNFIDLMFNPYTTTKGNDNTQHKGLGLSIVKNLVEKSNGIIWVTNPKLSNSRYVVVMNIRFLKSGFAGDTTTATAADEDDITLEELELLI
jgi:signal transduction histidine kinase